MSAVFSSTDTAAVDTKSARPVNDEKQNPPLTDQASFTSANNVDDDSPFEVVRAAVSNKDDPSIPSLTVRVWILGILFTVVLSAINQFFWFRDNPIRLEIIIVQLLSYPLGRLCEWLPDRRIRIFNWCSFRLNPGPFTVKEHVLVSIFANAGATTAYAIDIVVIKELWYKSSIGFGASIMLLLSSQLIGYGLAGVVRRYLVQPAAMIWPATLINVILFRTLHESTSASDDLNASGSKNESLASSPAARTLLSPHNIWNQLRQISKWSRIRFFWVFFAISFVYYFFPGYLFTVLAAVPVLCLLAPGNVVANQLGDGLRGLGMLALSFDWSIVSSAYLSSPMATPFWAACNMFFGFVVVIWIIVPIGYYSNLWNTAYLPIFTPVLYDTDGQEYNITRTYTDGRFSSTAYDGYSPVRLNFQFALSYGLEFAGLASLISYIALHHGREVWQRFRQAHAMGDDIHARLMRRYPEVPHWWYAAIFGASIAMAIALCESFDVELPWWGLLLAVGIAMVFIVPIGIIQAVTNQQPGLNIVTEFVIGLILPGKPIANVTFKTYGYITMTQGLSLIQDLKLGYYMKIPPRHMLICQTVGTIIAATMQLVVAYWLMGTVPNICTPQGFPWTCRSAETFYSASVIWGLIGPAKMFGPLSPYHPLLWFFLGGFLLPFPFYYLQRQFPGTWVQFIHIPLILFATGNWPPAPTVDFPMWFFWCFVFNFAIHRYRRQWWNKYTFTLSAALDAGLAVAGLVIFFAFQNNGLEVNWWGTQPTLCPHGADPLRQPFTNALA
ncbi:hypothetical protein H4R35_001136 [Dimargaris xerosporica]|nr:hypothetical protein H4R35_001136 [Dimargaris xerosporica]